jgi:hypothetical protein
MWDVSYVSVSKVVLGPLVPLTFWSQYEANKMISKWPGTADYHVLKHPDGVDPEQLESEQVGRILSIPVIFQSHPLSLILPDAPRGWFSTILLRLGMIHSYLVKAGCLQARAASDAVIADHLGCVLAWPAAQENAYNNLFKPRAKALSPDDTHEDAISDAACKTWTSATSAVNKVSMLFVLRSM